MCKILSRIKVIADTEGITIGAIERAIGASRGVISKAITKGTDIQSKWLEHICEKFPSYSPIWLLTGEGEMIRSDTTRPQDAKIITAEHQLATPSTPADDMVDRLMTYLKDKDNEIGRLNKEIGRLEARVEELERNARVHVSPQYAHTSETVPT